MDFGSINPALLIAALMVASTPILLAALGEVIERHMIAIGFLKTDDGFNDQDTEAQVVNLNPAPAAGDGEDDHPHNRGMRFCPKCNQPGLIQQSGCDTCLECGYSKCG